MQLCLEQYNNWPYVTYLFFELCNCSGHSATDFFTKCRKTCNVVSAPDELKSNPGHLIAIVQHPTKSSKVMSRCICIVQYYKLLEVFGLKAESAYRVMFADCHGFLIFDFM